MRANFVNADGGYQYRLIEKIIPEMRFALMPRLNLFATGDLSTIIEIRKRRFEFYGTNENGVIEYREIVE